MIVWGFGDFSCTCNNGFEIGFHTRCCSGSFSIMSAQGRPNVTWKKKVLSNELDEFAFEKNPGHIDRILTQHVRENLRSLRATPSIVFMACCPKALVESMYL